MTTASYINWLKAYVALGMEVKYVEFIKTHSVREDSDYWHEPVIRGVTCNKVVSVLRSLNVCSCTDNLNRDVSVNDRDPNIEGSYVVGFRRTVEADEGNKNLSANILASRKHRGITLLERLLLELGYILTTGQRMDTKNLTVCTGSRHRNGLLVPGVGWDPVDREVCIVWVDPEDQDIGLRSRTVFSLAA